MGHFHIPVTLLDLVSGRFDVCYMPGQNYKERVVFVSLGCWKFYLWIYTGNFTSMYKVEIAKLWRTFGGFFFIFSHSYFTRHAKNHMQWIAVIKQSQRNFVKTSICFDKMTVLMRNYHYSLVLCVATPTIRTKFLFFWEITSCCKFIFHIRCHGTGNEVCICGWKET